jgi:phage recombination protein Bet
MNTAGKSLATLPTTSDTEAWTAEEKAIIEAAGLVFTHSYGDRRGEKVLAPRPVVARFLHTCERTGLDPLARQIYCIGRFGSDGLEWSIQTAIDGFRVIAERSKKYAGQGAPEWLTASGEWVPVFVKALHGEHPLAARVNVYRHDWDKPAVGIATWDEYAQYTKKGALTAMWQQRGPGQLAKCAEALGLRKAFPQDLSGIYTDDEMRLEVTPVDESAAAEPGTNWAALITAATTRDELEEIKVRMVDADEATDTLKAAWLARAGVLSREAITEDAQIVSDEPTEAAAAEPPAASEPATLAEETEAEYEARIAAEHEAAVARGEVSP